MTAVSGFVAVMALSGAVILGPPAKASVESSSPVPLHLETPPGGKPRVVVTADPELDDLNSLIRYLLYSSDYVTEGLIYASSQFHWTGDGKGTELSVPNREYNRFGLNLCPCTSWRWEPGERFIDDAVDAYKQQYPNLRIHRPDYPSPDALKSKIRWGNVEFDGEMSKDTPGSDLIKTLLLDNKEEPIYLHAWGGQSTIARALKSIEEQFRGTAQWDAVRAKVIRKAVIHPSGDQDDTYANYIKPNWPEIRYRQQSAGVPYSYNAQDRVSASDGVFFTASWTKQNVTDRGALGALYRVWGDGKQMVKGDRFDYFGIAGKTAQELKDEGYVVWAKPREKGEFLAEGDTGTFINLINNGLDGYRGDSFGGWGGHAGRDNSVAGSGDHFAAVEATASNYRASAMERPTSNHLFLAAAQRDFAARLSWATTASYAQANHNPSIALAGPSKISVRAGERVKLHARAADPDGDRVKLKWWVWEDAGSYAGDVDVRPSAVGATIMIPIDAKTGDTIQLIAEATDTGTPALTNYRKIVFTLVP